MQSAVAMGAEVEPRVIRSGSEFRAVLEGALREVEGDERALTLLSAAAVRVRFAFTDNIGLVLNVAAGGRGDERLSWSFSDDVDWAPRLELEMDSEVANRYLQGRESLAVAIARGRVRCRGESHVALLYLPAIRLLCEPYRRVLAADFPHLAAA
jgi:hypothetical protein